MSEPTALSLGLFLLDDRGRLGRKGFWSFCLIALLVSVVILVLAGPRRMVLAHTIFGILMIYPCYCVFAKRLQDLDVPGTWAIVMVGIAAVDIVTGLVGLSHRGGWAAIFARYWPYVSNFNLLVTIIILGILPGSPAKNRYGPVAEF
ncbi:MAG: DUF805 domain-containing protein [Proteobacteria bacterium]|nr:DUF805 domain-containing protein [Pseudomonadota bacterium]